MRNNATACHTALLRKKAIRHRSPEHYATSENEPTTGAGMPRHDLMRNEPISLFMPDPPLSAGEEQTSMTGVTT